MSNSRALELCVLLDDHGVKDVIGLKMGADCSWASFLLIGTATSRVHMNGAASAVREWMHQNDVEATGGRKTDADTWKIIDGGDIVVSLMDSDSREFYALEERWFDAQVMFPEEGQSSISS